MYQHKNSVKQAETSHWNKLGLRNCPLHKSNSLDDNPAKLAKSSTKGLLSALCSRVCVASILAPEPNLLLFFVFVRLDIVKTLTRCYLQTYIAERVSTAKKHRQQQQHQIPHDDVAMRKYV